jgi:hypothetical protein
MQYWPNQRYYKIYRKYNQLLRGNLLADGNIIDGIKPKPVSHNFVFQGTVE